MHKMNIPIITEKLSSSFNVKTDRNCNARIAIKKTYFIKSFVKIVVVPNGSQRLGLGELRVFCVPLARQQKLN